MYNFSNISPYVRRVWDHTAPDPFIMNERELFDYELIYIKSGKVKINIEGTCYEGTEGCLFIIKPRQKHIIHFYDTPVRQPHIHFDFFEDSLSPDLYINYTIYEKTDPKCLHYFRKNILDSEDFIFPNMIRLKNPLVFEKLFFSLLHEYENNLSFHNLYCKGIFIEIWSFILREIYYTENMDIYDKFQEILSVKQYLDDNIDSTVSLDDLAEISHISKYHLSRLFKKHYGISPIQYHTNIRIDHAKYLLLYSNMTVSEISERCGFSCIHTFTRAFKNKEGFSPTKYKQTARNS